MNHFYFTLMSVQVPITSDDFSVGIEDISVQLNLTTTSFKFQETGAQQIWFYFMSKFLDFGLFVSQELLGR